MSAGVGGRAGRIVAAGHVDLDVAEAVLGEVRLERGERVGRGHVGHEPQIELGHRACGRIVLPPGPV